VPFQPWAKALFDFRKLRGGLDDPHSRCQPAGGMRFMTVPNGMEFVDQPELKRIIMIDGENRNWKRIAMEPGRQHPSSDDLNPSYFGDSIGHWEGDTLVVDTVGFNERSWIDRAGTPYTEQLHFIERLTRTDHDTMKYQVTIDDPGAYTATWSTSVFTIKWLPGVELFEYVCQESNYANQLMVGTFDKVDRSTVIVP
jgi:hypothetical protein